MNKPLEMPDSYTYADYYAWPDALRGELIDGEFYDMSPAPTAAHQDIAGILYYQLMGFFLQHPRLRPYQAPFDVRLPADPAQEDAAIKDVVQPDVCVCDAAKVDDKGCRGAPEWIIEVLSRRTQVKDQQAKRALYQRSGVSMYWIVSPKNRTVLYLSLKDGCYSDLAVPVPASGCVDVPQYPGLVIDWDQAFNRLLGRTE